MIKLIHTADLHLDSPLKSLALRSPELRARIEQATRSAFTRIVDTALSEGVAALLIAGDLFDGTARSARTAAFLMAEFDRLGAAGIQVFLIRGNHDADSPITGALDLPAHVHAFGLRSTRRQLTEGVWIHGVSFNGPHATESLLPHFSAPVPGAVNIALLHTSLSGAEGHDPYAPCTPADLAAMGFDYWALGHVHRRQVHGSAPWIVMPGMPQGRDIGEAGPKSATLLTINAGRIAISEIPTAAVEFRESLFAATADSDEALRHALRAHLRAEAGGAPAVLRLRFTGAAPRHWQILRDRATWEAQAHDLAAETGNLWIDKLSFDLSPPDAAAQEASEELGRAMAAIAGEEGFRAQALEDLHAVLEDLAPNLRARLIPDPQAEAALLDRLMEDGRDRVLAAMKGALA